MRSFIRLPNAIARDSSLTGSEFRVLVALMSVKPCYPSYVDISNWTGLSVNTVNRTLKKLKDKGIVSWKRGNSFGKNNEYFIHPKHTWKPNQSYPQNGVVTTPKTGIPKRLIRETNNEPTKVDLDLAALSKVEIEALRESINRIDE